MLPAGPKSRPVFRFGRFRLVPSQRELLVEGVPAELGDRAFEILLALVEAHGDVVTKDELLERVWPGLIVEDNTLQVHISALRRVLGLDRDLLKTLSGRGYRFVAEVTTEQSGTDGSSVATLAATPSEARTNLPTPTSDLIGRDVELEEVLMLAADRRLVTLTGAGGIGKTRLGLAVARQLLARFAGGAWVAELAQLTDPALVPATVARALGLSLVSDTLSAESVAAALKDRQLLLVLDNCEHVVEAAAITAEALLRVSPHIAVLATSREPLRAEAEYVYQVPPLDVPPG